MNRILNNAKLVELNEKTVSATLNIQMFMLQYELPKKDLMKTSRRDFLIHAIF